MTNKEKYGNEIIELAVNGGVFGLKNGQSGWRQLKVIAWMPLPEPYEEREDV